MLKALVTASLLAKVEAAGLIQEQVSWSPAKEEAVTREAERARKETSGSMLPTATAIVMSDDNEKEWTRCSKTNAGNGACLRSRRRRRRVLPDR